MDKSSTFSTKNAEFTQSNHNPNNGGEKVLNKVEELLTRGVSNIIPNKQKLEELLKNKKLNVYLGIDPTSTRIHLGHTVPLRKLQAFADLGHNVTFLIGDYTALIGDTSDKDSERPALTSEEIEKNFQTYKKQAEKILDFSKIKVRHNSEWLSKLDFKKVLELCMKFSANDLNSRELIKKRLNIGNRVGLHEFLYPVMQGYDSYFMDTDLQIGGTDQTFNMQAGRTLQKLWRNKESFILATEFLPGTDGRKMSKTWGNAIWLDDTPSDMYAKIMAIKDDLIIPYFTLATNISLEEIRKIEEELKNENPINIKKKLAEEIVAEMHGPKPSEEAQEDFEETVQQKQKPTDIPLRTISNSNLSLEEVLVETELASSKSEAGRLIKQGGVRVNDKKTIGPSAIFSKIANSGATIQVGPIRFVKVKW